MTFNVFTDKKIKAAPFISATHYAIKCVLLFIINVILTILRTIAIAIRLAFQRPHNLRCQKMNSFPIFWFFANFTERIPYF